MRDPHDDLTPAEIKALEQLPDREEPPVWLEESVVNELKRKGFVVADGVVGASRARGAIRPMTGRAVAAALAASVLIFVSGLLSGLYLPRGGALTPPAPAPGERQFVLFLYEDETYQAPATERASERVDEYKRWAQGLARNGQLVDGNKLKESVELLPAGGPAPQERLGTLAGYFILAARDSREALALAAGCPHLKYHGRIAIREIDPV